MIRHLGLVLRALMLALIVAVSLSPTVAVAGGACQTGGASGSGSTSCNNFSGGGQSTPWEQSTNNLENLLTGAPAKAISIIAIVVAGVALVFGEDLGAFAKRLLMVVIAVAMIIGAGSIVSTVFSATI